MSPVPHLPPQQLISGRVFCGQCLANPRKNPELFQRYSTATPIVETIQELSRTGAGGLVSTVTPAIVSAVRQTKFPFYPIIPNIMGYVREATHAGVARAGLRRLLRTGAWNLSKLAVQCFGSLPKLIYGDFSVVMEILLEIELRDLAGCQPQVVFLHSTTVDLALALENWELLKSFCLRMRQRWKVEPGLVTYNLGKLLPALETHNIHTQYIIAPVNREGYLMNPDKQTCEKEIKASSHCFIGDRIAPYRDPLSDDATYLSSLGIQSYILDINSDQATPSA